MFGAYGEMTDTVLAEYIRGLEQQISWSINDLNRAKTELKRRYERQQEASITKAKLKSSYESYHDPDRPFMDLWG